MIKPKSRKFRKILKIADKMFDGIIFNQEYLFEIIDKMKTYSDDARQMRICIINFNDVISDLEQEYKQALNVFIKLYYEMDVNLAQDLIKDVCYENRRAFLRFLEYLNK